jgi:hypothetical protein
VGRRRRRRRRGERWWWGGMVWCAVFVYVYVCGWVGKWVYCMKNRVRVKAGYFYSISI